MPMKIATVDILVEKAHFEPQVAVAIAQAIDVAMEEKMQDRQLVTMVALSETAMELRVEIQALGTELRGEIQALRTELRGEIETLRTELRGEIEALRAEFRAELQATAAALRVEMHAMKSDLLRHMYTAMLGQLALLIGVSYFLVLHVNK
jgi:hypothetical protein